MTKRLYRITKKSKNKPDAKHWIKNHAGLQSGEIAPFMAGNVGLQSVTHKNLTEKEATFLRLQGAVVEEMTDEMGEETTIRVYRNRNGSYEKIT